MPFASGAWFPDGGHGAVRDVDRGTPLAECQWWVDWLGDEWESAGAPKVFSSHGSGYGNWEVFSPRVRTARLRGGVAQLSPEEDFRTSVEGGLPYRHLASVAAVTANRRNPGGGGVGRGAGFSPPPLANAAATSALSVLCRVVAAAAAEACAAAAAAATRPTRTPTSGPMGDAAWATASPRRMDCGWGDHPVWMVHLGHLGVSSLEALVGCLVPLLFRGIAWLLPGTLSSSGGTRRTTRKRWLKGRRRGRSGSDPRRLFGWAELWICQGWIRRGSVPIALTGPALTTPPG